MADDPLYVDAQPNWLRTRRARNTTTLDAPEEQRWSPYAWMDQPRKNGKFASTGPKDIPTPGGSRTANPHAPTWNDLQRMTRLPTPDIGFNEGQWYQDTATGREFYVKSAPSAAHALNEVAANQVYEALGAVPGKDIPYVSLVHDPAGQAFIVSEKIPDLRFLTKQGWEQDAAARAAAEKYWAADALLSHRDMVGVGVTKYSNMGVRPDGGVTRIEAGGAMAFRGAGPRKPDWTPTSAWLDPWTLRGESRNGIPINETHTAVFGQISDARAATLLGEAAARLTPERLDGLRESWARLGMSKEQIETNFAVLRARLAQIPQIQQELAPKPAPSPQVVPASVAKPASARPRKTAAPKPDLTPKQTERLKGQLKEARKEYAQQKKLRDEAQHEIDNLQYYLDEFGDHVKDPEGIRRTMALFEPMVQTHQEHMDMVKARIQDLRALLPRGKKLTEEMKVFRAEQRKSIVADIRAVRKQQNAASRAATKAGREVDKALAQALREQLAREMTRIDILKALTYQQLEAWMQNGVDPTLDMRESTKRAAEPDLTDDALMQRAEDELEMNEWDDLVADEGDDDDDEPPAAE